MLGSERALLEKSSPTDVQSEGELCESAWMERPSDDADVHKPVSVPGDEVEGGVEGDANKGLDCGSKRAILGK